MASTETAENGTLMHNDMKTDPEKAGQSESELGGDTERAPEAIPDDKPVVAGPPDGGAMAWLVVLGGWCCSFSSPGWINSMHLLYH